LPFRLLGPLKYSVLPQYLEEHELVGGNGMIEMGTFLAILIGQIIGSLMTEGGPPLLPAAYRGVWLAVQPRMPQHRPARRICSCPSTSLATRYGWLAGLAHC
jgi:hypothetical protein